MRYKKAIEVGTIFMFIIAIVVGGLILLFGYKVFSNIVDTSDTVDYQEFHSELQKNLDTQKRRYGSRKVFDYELPRDVKYIFFVDLDRKVDIINNPMLKSYPLIRDAIESDVKKNMYIIRTGGEFEPFYVGEIMLAKVGEENCSGLGKVDVREGRFSLAIRGKGGKAYIGDECEGLYLQIWYPEKEYDKINEFERIKFSLNDQNEIMLNEMDTRKGKRYVGEGNLTSNIIVINDLNNFNILNFYGEEPADTSIRFQLAVSNDTRTGLDNFTGPDGTNESFYTYSGQPIHGSLKKPGEPLYMRFKAIFESDMPDNTSTPTLSKVMISYYKNNLEQENPSELTGGPCSYDYNQGTCKITSVLENADEETYEVKFTYNPGERLELTEEQQTIYDNQVSDKEQHLMLSDGKDPKADFIDRYTIKNESRYNCRLGIINKGTCSPWIFDFNNIDED